MAKAKAHLVTDRRRKPAASPTSTPPIVESPCVPEQPFVLPKSSLRETQLYPTQGVVLGEDKEAFALFAESVYGEFLPVGMIEVSIVERMISTLWRMRRVPRIEAGRYIWQRYAMSCDGILGYSEKQFRARVEKAATDQYAAGFASATGDPHSAAAAAQIPTRGGQDRGRRLLRTRLAHRYLRAAQLRSQTRPATQEAH
jgi:hypothetical protein